jgi:hypothetical protein
MLALPAPASFKRNTGAEMLNALHRAGIAANVVTRHRDGVYCAEFFTPDCGSVPSSTGTRSPLYWKARLQMSGAYNIQQVGSSVAHWRSPDVVISVTITFEKRQQPEAQVYYLPPRVSVLKVGEMVLIRQRELRIARVEYIGGDYWYIVDISPQQDGSMMAGFSEKKVSGKCFDY